MFLSNSLYNSKSHSTRFRLALIISACKRSPRKNLPVPSPPRLAAFVPPGGPPGARAAFCRARASRASSLAVFWRAWRRSPEGGGAWYMVILHYIKTYENVIELLRIQACQLSIVPFAISQNRPKFSLGLTNYSFI